MKKFITVDLKTYIAGLTNVDLNKVMICGEDLVNNRMLVTLVDWSDWEEFGAKTVIHEKRTDVEKIIKSLQKHLDESNGGEFV